MDAGLPKLLESHFGPESELIEIKSVTQTISERMKASVLRLEQHWSSISQDRKSALASECSTSDLKSTLQETWADPTLSSFLLKDQDQIAAALNQGSYKDGKATRRGQLSAPDMMPPEVRALHDSMNNVKLSSWTFPTEAAAFIRPPRNSDQNAFSAPKPNETGRAKTITSEDEAMVIVTIFDKVPWSPCYVTRLSQHAFLSSQTLDEVCKAIPCAPHAGRIPSNVEGPVHTYVPEEDSGCVLCIEGLAYGDNQEDDYATKLVDHLTTVSKSKATLRKAINPLNQTTLSSLSLRVNEPYWFLHRGNCEHYVLFEQIRSVNLIGQQRLASLLAPMEIEDACCNLEKCLCSSLEYASRSSGSSLEPRKSSSLEELIIAALILTSSGFGRELTLSALNRGDKVIATTRARSLSQLDHLKARGAEVLELDVTAPVEKVNEIATKAIGIYGRIDVLVNNAGSLLVGAIEENTGEETLDQFNANLFGSLALTRGILPHMRERKSGTIVFFGSVGGWISIPNAGIYVATKFAARGLVSTLHDEIAPLGLRAVCIEPGYFRTRLFAPENKQAWESRIADYKPLAEQMESMIQMADGHQPGDPHKAAEIIVDLVRGEGVAQGKAWPKSLALGPDCYGMIKEELRKASESLEEWKEVTSSTDF
ncbi:hypothetical protein NP233_g5433 [Leucocoprinus birnbaumii]|uniref:Uncharacterized protein n=1 Tax=Leucocoprinus birnbaumii TaxID=56174 RepID=A0AAD5VSW2_9AGAR|nr:hypothetical protein NP233_g5433 [Leucocoprinus birnbaumii]